MPKDATVKVNAVCPACYSQTGHSIVMGMEKGVYHCPQNPQHKYKRGQDGFLERTEAW